MPTVTTRPWVSAEPLHLAVEIPWSDNGWIGSVCNDPTSNYHCRRFKDYASRIDLEFEVAKPVAGLRWLRKPVDRPDSPRRERPYHLPCLNTVNLFGAGETSYSPPVHGNVYGRGGVLKWKFQRKWARLPASSFAFNPSHRMRRPDTFWIKSPRTERKRLEDFWGCMQPNRSWAFLFANDHPLSGKVGVLPIAFVPIEGITSLGDHPSREAYPPYPVWERIIQHGFPRSGVRIPWQSLSLSEQEELAGHCSTIFRNLRQRASGEMRTQEANDVAVAFAELAKIRNSWVEGSLPENLNTAQPLGDLRYSGLAAAFCVLGVPTPSRLVEATMERLRGGELDSPWLSLEGIKLVRPRRLPGWPHNRPLSAFLADSRVRLAILASELSLSWQQFEWLWHRALRTPEIAEQILHDPYLLADRLWCSRVRLPNVSVAEIDRAVGYTTSITELDGKRREAKVSTALSTSLADGSTAVRIETLPGRYQETLLKSTADLERTKAISLADAGVLATNRDFLDWEQGLFNQLTTIASHHKPLEGPADEDRQLIEDAAAGILGGGLQVLLGGPGTGKSGLVTRICRWLENSKYTWCALTPTGRAATVLQQNGTPARTLHSWLLERQWFDGRVFRQGEIRQTIHAVVVDEASMVTSEQLYWVMESINLDKLRLLVLVGDENQLPPVGRGQPLIDLLEWVRNRHPERVHQLTVNRRSLDASKELALHIASYFKTFARVPFRVAELAETVDAKTLNFDHRCWKSVEELHGFIEEFLFDRFPVSNPRARDFVRLADVRKAKFARQQISSKGLLHALSWQVLTTTNEGLAGVSSLNECIQRQIERARKIARMRVETVGLGVPKAGDKVIKRINGKVICRADGFIGKVWVANGTIGTVHVVTWVGRRNGTNRLSYFLSFDGYDGLLFEMSQRKAHRELDLGYALTIHRSQGSTFDDVCVVIPYFPPDSPPPSNLIYTSLTRHRRSVRVLMGIGPAEDQDAALLRFLSCGEKAAGEPRLTLLPHLLKRTS